MSEETPLLNINSPQTHSVMGSRLLQICSSCRKNTQPHPLYARSFRDVHTEPLRL
ncbi:hypothetical protein L210DRAFT_3514494 [Boletus edulis BED1]|uniref:Uncharacterized protein n=1 Tax=Boletus edulis BED1 TaxID=1328754 RepID=A0AAD4C7S8_BOLED|nr:hypothetical protein L210DRAFT_3514494 [Boletus edulis BED1]